MKIELAKTEIIHFIGIGGIGMSGLSLIMKSKGLKVQGSDISFNKNITEDFDALEKSQTKRRKKKRRSGVRIKKKAI